MAHSTHAHEQYTVLRNRLSGNIEKLLAADAAWRASGLYASFKGIGLADDKLDGLAEKRRKLLSNQFSIALMGEFQGGKSTTVNALCGGVEFSARGNGRIPTSSCVLRIRHDEEAAKTGEAEIEWRTDEQIYRVFSGILGDRIADTTPEGKIKPGILRDPEVLAALEEEWKEYEANKSGYQNLDALRVGRLLTAACRHSDRVDAIRARTRMKISEVQECLRFAARYERMEPKDATPESLKFLLIKEVHIAVNSPILKELGVEIMDCPGLNARTYDTKITQELIEHADAVMTLVSTEGKKISQSEINSLKNARTLRGGTADGLFVCMNVKGQTFGNFDGCLAQENGDALEDQGIEVGKFWNYHALLAHLALQGKQHFAGSLPPDSRDRFIQSCDLAAGTSYESAWETAVKKLLETAGAPQITGGLTLENCDKVYAISRFGPLTAAMKDFIVKRRGRHVLVTNGVEPTLAQVGGWIKGIENLTGTLGGDEKKELERLGKFQIQLNGFKVDLGWAVDSEVKKIEMPSSVRSNFP